MTSTEKNYKHKPDGMEGDQYENLLRRLAELEDIRLKIKELRDYERDLIGEIHDIMPMKKVALPTFGVVEKTWSSNKRWDHESMWNVLMARARDARMIDKETGEVLESEGQAVRRVIEECAYVSYWRTTPLIEKYGIDPDEYTETTSKRIGIRMQKPTNPVTEL